MSTDARSSSTAATGVDRDEPATERERALQMIKRRRDLATHAVSFLVINAAVWILWALTGQGYPWPAWLTGLWGIGLVLNAWDVYARRPVTEADVRNEIERMHARQH